MEEAEIWLKKAEEDFEIAEFNKNNDKLSYAAFLYQQAIEKGLKALMIKKGHGLLKTHDCFVLTKRLDAPRRIINKADTVSPYYFRTRYPDAEGVKLNEEDINEIHENSLEVLEWIKKNF